MLTHREGDVLLLLAAGCTYAQVALRLGISVHTVGTHVKNCYRKLGARCAAQAVTRAHELDLMPPGLS
jgi:DNA-binding CsgD family transcriptional regulator